MKYNCWTMKKDSHHTPETLEKMRANRKGKACGDRNAMANPEHRAKAKAGVQAVWDSRPAIYKDRDWLFDQYVTQRKTIIQIANECGSNHVTIWNWIKKFGIEVRGMSPRDAKYKDRDWLFDQYVTQQKPMHQIADEIGASTKVIGNWLSKFGIEARTNPDWMCGDKAVMKRPEVVAKISGKNHYHWNGGSSMYPYCEKWTPAFRKRIRAFFGNICILCGKTEKENGEPLCCHHVHYNKRTCCDDSTPMFATLCRSCHNKTTASHRAKWITLLEGIIKDRYGGKSYFTKEEYAVYSKTKKDKKC